MKIMTRSFFFFKKSQNMPDKAETFVLFNEYLITSVTLIEIFIIVEVQQAHKLKDLTINLSF